MHMNVKAIISGTILGLATVPVLFQEARSDSLPAWGGKHVGASQESCFGPYGWSGVLNTSCNGYRVWYMPVQNRWGTGTRTFQVTGDAITGFDTPAECKADVANASGSLLWNSGWVDADGSVTLGSFNSTSSSNTFQIVCNMPGPDLDPRLGVHSARVL